MLITIIESSGSTPRGRGAQMLVGKNGLITGTIGGGAIEKEAIEIAIRAIDAHESFAKSFELNQNDSSLNMICGGALKLSFVYLSKDLMEDEINKMNTCINNDQSGFMVIDTNAWKVYLSSEFIDDENVVCLPIITSDRVIVFGGGHVAQALVPVLSKVGFSCIVMENRDMFAVRENYPDAKDVVLGNYERIDDYISIKPTDYAVIMTHGHLADYAILEQLLRKDLVYVGVMGSRRKLAIVNEKLRAEGFSEDKIKSFHSPIGLAIGAVTPEEIAISVVSEMIMVRAKLKGQTGEKVCPSTL